MGVKGVHLGKQQPAAGSGHGGAADQPDPAHQVNHVPPPLLSPVPTE